MYILPLSLSKKTIINYLVDKTYLVMLRICVTPLLLSSSKFEAFHSLKNEDIFIVLSKVIYWKHVYK